jgi:hypothetical protein
LSRLFWGMVVFRHHVIIGIEMLSKWRKGKLTGKLIVYIKGRLTGKLIVYIKGKLTRKLIVYIKRKLRKKNIFLYFFPDV